jgi:general secretion pathway protein E
MAVSKPRTTGVAEQRPTRPSFGFARRHGATIVAFGEHGARVAHRPGVKPEIIAELRRHAGQPLTLETLDPTAFDRLLRELYEGGSDDARAMVADFDDTLDLNQIADALPEPTDLLESDDDAPIIRLINAMLTEADQGKCLRHPHRAVREPPGRALPRRRRAARGAAAAEGRGAAGGQPHQGHGQARHRREAPAAGRPHRPAHRRASGRRARLDHSPGHGERVVLRLLDKQAGRLDLPQLGMDPVTLERIDELIHRPHGILLVTGPTGSGKTTTLYAGADRLNDRRATS